MRFAHLPTPVRLRRCVARQAAGTQLTGRSKLYPGGNTSDDAVDLANKLLVVSVAGALVAHLRDVRFVIEVSQGSWASSALSLKEFLMFSDVQKVTRIATRFRAWFELRGVCKGWGRC
jgi:hypothetical protein